MPKLLGYGGGDNAGSKICHYVNGLNCSNSTLADMATVEQFSHCVFCVWGKLRCVKHVRVPTTLDPAAAIVRTGRRLVSFVEPVTHGDGGWWVVQKLKQVDWM